MLKDWEQKNGDFTLKKKFESGQTAELSITKYFSSNHKDYYNVGLGIYHKRKSRDFQELSQTGKDNLRPLIWAKRAIQDFWEDAVCADSREVYLYVGYSNSRRFRIYEYFLAREGFSKVKIDNQWALIKKIRQE